MCVLRVVCLLLCGTLNPVANTSATAHQQPEAQRVPNPNLLILTHVQGRGIEACMARCPQVGTAWTKIMEVGAGT